MGVIRALEERQLVAYTQVQLDLQDPQVLRDCQEHQEQLVTQGLEDIQNQAGNRASQVAEVIQAVGDILSDRDHQEHQVRKPGQYSHVKIVRTGSQYCN